MRAAISNPGSGTVDAEADGIKIARANMDAFIADLAIDFAVITPVAGKGRGDGRFPFTVTAGDRSVVVHMPGIALDRVRYMNDWQNPFLYPRLFVDGSSWLWVIAINVVRESLQRKETA